MSLPAGEIIGPYGSATQVFMTEDGYVVTGKASNNSILWARYGDTGALLARSQYDFQAFFSPGGGGVALNGNTIVAGARQAFSLGPYDFVLVAFDAAGQLDRSFGVNGAAIADFGVDSYGFGFLVQPDGKLVQVGTLSGNSKFALARFDSNGNVDPTFGSAGKVTTSFDAQGGATAQAVALQSDGKLVVAGGMSGPSAPGGAFALARYRSDGSLDDSFGIGGKIWTSFGAESPQGAGAQSVVVQADGKILVAGNGSGAQLLARYNVDGTLDTSFGGDGKVSIQFDNSSALLSMTLQPDGKIITAGYVISRAGNDFALVRLNPDGSLDTSFDSDGMVATDFGSIDHAVGVLVQSDGKILAVGLTGGGSNVALARYNGNGTLDPTFNGIAVPRPLSGDDSSNVLVSRTGDDVIDGRGGVDTVIFLGASYQYGVARSADGGLTITDHVQGRDGTDRLTNVERLKFTDKLVAYDLDGAAGTVTKILGVVFGTAAVSNERYVGIGLTYADAGLTYVDLVGLALREAGVTTHAAAVNLLWYNLFGDAPAQEQAAPYLALLESGAQSIASLGVLAAEQDLNAQNIGLVGLHATGVTYSL